VVTVLQAFPNPGQEQHVRTAFALQAKRRRRAGGQLHLEQRGRGINFRPCASMKLVAVFVFGPRASSYDDVPREYYDEKLRLQKIAEKHFCFSFLQ
jgi:hypothetical protein